MDYLQEEIRRISWEFNCPLEISTDKEKWRSICKWGHLSENFIRKFQDKVDWKTISKWAKLSESFIREFSEKLDWNDICRYQKISPEFAEEFKHKVDWNIIIEYQSCGKEVRDKLIANYLKKTNKSKMPDFEDPETVRI